ncbi:hypothetical protein BD779DRAFT_1476719 [Infundibulicybe gibba]|nr:hypothetical protein BD779DRAFT_1476719 [Infundibulicybe gibba]
MSVRVLRGSLALHSGSSIIDCLDENKRERRNCDVENLREAGAGCHAKTQEREELDELEKNGRESEGIESRNNKIFLRIDQVPSCCIRRFPALDPRAEAVQNEFFKQGNLRILWADVTSRCYKLIKAFLAELSLSPEGKSAEAREEIIGVIEGQTFHKVILDYMFTTRILEIKGNEGRHECKVINNLGGRNQKVVER